MREEAEHRIHILFARGLRQKRGRHLYILLDRQARKDTPALHEVAYSESRSLIGREACDNSALKLNLSCGGLKETGDDAQQCGLAGAVWANHGDGLLRPQV